MGKPSKEAWAEAQSLPAYDNRAIAAAIQRHMDETDRWRKRWEDREVAQASCCDEMQLRAEKAERAYAELRSTSIEKLRLEESARAEKAERQLEEEREWFAASQRGLAEANARLAELVREVVDWIASTDGVVAPWSKLLAILKRYEQPPKVQP